jgi:hypothetical protein
MNYYQTEHAGNVGCLHLTKYFKFTMIIKTEIYESEAIEKLFDIIKETKTSDSILDHFGIEQIEGDDND